MSIYINIYIIRVINECILLLISSIENKMEVHYDTMLKIKWVYIYIYIFRVQLKWGILQHMLKELEKYLGVRWTTFTNS